MGYLSGSEYVTYTPVEAYGVSMLADGVISGGFGDDATVSGGARFYWVYDPNTPYVSPSGFTGTGWYEGVDDSPIAVYTDLTETTFESLIGEFAAEPGRTNLNDVFLAWNNWATTQEWQQGQNPVTRFFTKVYLNGSSCAEIIGGA